MSRIDQLFSFLESQPNEPFLLFAIAKEFESKDEKLQALEYYQRLEATTPQYVGLYYHLGKLYERLGQPEKALDTYKTGMSVAQQEKDMHAYNELAGAKMNISDEDDDDY